MEPGRSVAERARAARALVLVASLAAAALARPAAAAEGSGAPSLPGWAGTFRYAGDARERAALASAIEEATADMGFIARQIARNRLEGEMRPDPTLVVRTTGSMVAIGEEGGWATVLDGPARVFDDDGERYRVRHRRAGAAIVQLIEGESVRIRKTYALSEDGSRMRVSVRFAHDRLSAPLLYELTYRRARG